MGSPLEDWLSTPFGAAIQKHIANGLKVFPLHGIRDDLSCTCGQSGCSAGKHPYSKTAPHGFSNATGDIEIAAKMFEYREDLNVGVATGATSGIFVIDVDNKVDNLGDNSLIVLQEMLGKLPNTLKLITGNGYHLVFDYPVGEDLRSNANTFGSECPGIDTRGNGGYIVIYPSRHHSGKDYSSGEYGDGLCDLPAEYISSIKAGKRKSEFVSYTSFSGTSGADQEWSVENISNALSVLDPDMGYWDWTYVGMGLHHGGFDFSMYNDWSARGVKYPGAKKLEAKWRGFRADGERTIGTVIDMAIQRGWTPKHEARVESSEAAKMVAPLVANIKKKIAQKIADEKKAYQQKVDPEPKKKEIEDFTPILSKNECPGFDFDPLEIPGIIGDTVRWITRHAINEQPELALLNVLAFCGSVFGRRYASPIDTRTNIYLVGIARTGGGKDHSRKMINSLAQDSGLSKFMGGNSIRSDTGMLRGLMTNSCQLLQMDEFGMFLQALSDSKSGYHIKSISRALTSLYSDSNSVYHHGEYADEKVKTIKIVCPNLCIFGTTTESSYVPALRKSAVESGELNRFIVIPSRTDIPFKESIPPRKQDKKIVEWWSKFAPSAAQSLGENVNSATILPAPKVVEWGECDQIQINIRKEQDEKWKSSDPMRDLWSRFYENTIKIAMLFAIARNPNKPSFSKEDFDYAYSIVKTSIAYMSRLAAHNMAENPQEEAYLEIMNTLKAKGAVSRKDLLGKFRKYKKREIEDILGMIAEEEKMLIERVTPEGEKPYIVYHYTGK